MNILEQEKTTSIDESKNPDISQENIDFFRSVINDGSLNVIVENYDLSDFPRDLANEVIDTLKVDIFENRPVFDLSFSTKLERILLANNITREMLWEHADYINDTQERIIKEIVFNNNAFIYLSPDFLPEPKIVTPDSSHRPYIDWPNEKLTQLRTGDPGLNSQEDQILFCSLLGINYNKPSLSTINLFLEDLKKKPLGPADFASEFTMWFYAIKANYNLPDPMETELLSYHLYTFADLPFVDSDLRSVLQDLAHYTHGVDPIFVTRASHYSKILDRPAYHRNTDLPIQDFPVTKSPVLFSEEDYQILSPLAEAVHSIYKQHSMSNILDVENQSYPNLMEYLKEISDKYQLTSWGKSSFDTGFVSYLDFQNLLHQPEVLQDTLYLYLYDTVNADKDINPENGVIDLKDYKDSSGFYSKASFIKKYILYPFFRQNDSSLFQNIENPRSEYFPVAPGTSPKKLESFLVPTTPFLYQRNDSSFFHFFHKYVFERLFEFSSLVDLEESYFKKSIIENLFEDTGYKALVKPIRSSELIAQDIVDSIFRFSDSVSLVLQSSSQETVYSEIRKNDNKLFEPALSLEDYISEKNHLNFNLLLIYDYYRYDMIPSYLASYLNLPRKKTSEILDLVDKKLEGFTSFSEPIDKQPETPDSISDYHVHLKLPTFSFK